MKFLREPLVHFMFIGAFIYLLYAVYAEPTVDESNNTIVVTSGEIEWMQTAWEKRWNRAPTEREFDGLIQQYIKETVMYREALTMGLNKHDQVIRRRLAQKLEFLAKDLVALTPPTEEELSVYFQANLGRYQPATRYTFTQVFVSPDKRGDSTLNDADKIKNTLIASGAPTEHSNALGDSLMLQNHSSDTPLFDIQRQFGNDFADTLVTLSTGQWHGPVLSGFGLHLVYVSSIMQAQPPALSEVRERVVRDWTADKSEVLNTEFYANLREQYTVTIEAPEQKITDAMATEGAQ